MRSVYIVSPFVRATGTLWLSRPDGGRVRHPPMTDGRVPDMLRACGARPPRTPVGYPTAESGIAHSPRAWVATGTPTSSEAIALRDHREGRQRSTYGGHSRRRVVRAEHAVALVTRHGTGSTCAGCLVA